MKKTSNIFTDEQALKTIDFHRVLYMLLAVVFFLITEIGRQVYRPFIYANDISDFGLADSIGNLGGIAVQIFFSIAILNSPGRKAINLILFLAGGYVLYEILQPYLPKGVFDWLDIYGTLLGGILSLIIILFIRKFIPNKVLFQFGS